MRRLGLIVAFALAATPALAEVTPDLPEAVLGTFAEGSAACAAAETVVHIKPRSIVTLSATGENRLLRIATTQTAGDWTVATAGGDDMARILLRPVAEGIDRVVPDPKAQDDQLPGKQTPIHLRRCETVPPLFAVLHGEGLAFLHGIEAMEPACADWVSPACIEAFMAYADVNKDGRLNPAELARLTRAAAWFTQMQGGATAHDLEAGQAVALIGGVLSGEVLVRSYDYDGKGSVTAQQLMQDRSTAVLQPQIRARPALPLDLGKVDSPTMSGLLSLLRLLN